MSRLLLISLLVIFTGARSAQAQRSAPANTILAGPNLPLKCNPSANNIFEKTSAGPLGDLYFCDSPDHWTLIGASSGGSSSGITPGASGGCGVVRTSATVLTIFPGASASLPCSFPLGNDIYSFTAPATATISAGTDTAYIYIGTSGVLTVGTNTQVVTCSGCTALTGITSFPASSVPIFTWANVSGVWVTSGVDRRTGGGRSRPPTTKSYGVTFSNSGGVVAAGAVSYVTVPHACTITAFVLWVNIASSAAFDVWKLASNTALPTVANSIIAGAAYLSITSNTKSYGVGTAPYTTPNIAAEDTLGFKLQTFSGTATQVHVELQCQE